jgi:SAM-dependent methyltransferase
MAREFTYHFVSIVARTLPIHEPIYEFGSYRGREKYQVYGNMRLLFKGQEFVGCDIREGYGVDKILNLHDIDLPDETAGTVLCLDTLEHVEFCHKAVSEMCRVLKPGGICVIVTVMHWQIHNHPNDYWRFTPAGLESLLKPFEEKYVSYRGKPELPHTVVGIGVKGSIDWQPFLSVWEGEL